MNIIIKFILNSTFQEMRESILLGANLLSFFLIIIYQAEITVSKFQNRVHVYGVEGGFPMFFDIDGRGTEIYPTGI